MAASGSSVTWRSRNPLWIVIVHSPARGRRRVDTYCPVSRPGDAVAVVVTSPDRASILGFKPLSRVTPCCRTVNVNVTGWPAVT